MMARPLVDIGREALGVEWSAALYESYVADREVYGNSPRYDSANRYALAAGRLAESLESEVYEEMDRALGATWR